MTERRRDPLTGEWRTFAPLVEDEPGCPLCKEPPDGGILVVEDRSRSFRESPPPPSVGCSDIYEVAPARGTAEMVVYSGDHEVTLADLDVEAITRLVEVWADRYAILAGRPAIAYVSICETRATGPAMGARTGAGTGAKGTPHPHSDIHGHPDIPPVPARELSVARAHVAEHGTCVMCDVVARERLEATRVVARNRTWLAYVPFAARDPYEVHLAAHRHATSLLDLTDPERVDLAALIHRVLGCWQQLCGAASPYVLAVHQAPTIDGPYLDISHLHLELLPLKKALSGGPSARHFGGSALGFGAFVSALSPEQAAAEFRVAAAVQPLGDGG